MQAELLFEIGCEEIPAKMLARALADLPALVEARLATARLTHGGVRALGTPRRLAIIVTQLADRQPDLDEEVVGPPVGAAFAPDGTLTKAGQGFATKNGVTVDGILKKEVAGKKGQYAVAQRHVAGVETRALLPALLAELIAAIPWPKSQRWGWTKVAFVRPVQWLVALYGGEVVPLEFAGVKSGRTSRGHRFLHNTGVEIANAGAYVAALHAAKVVVDQDQRKAHVASELDRLETERGLKIRRDETLLGEVIHLGEWLVGLLGDFNPDFLEVPEEMLVTSMRNHQRYFAVEKYGKLAPHFVTMMATIVADPKVVAAGNGKVLASRLSDAKFFFGQDRTHSFAEWNEKLDGVVFQAKLGDKAKSIGAKVRRITDVVATLATQFGFDAELARSAASVCKADLASQAVGEFPELQGIMGRHYAKAFGQSAGVATAIDEHWWPKGQGAALPVTDAGVLIALADRMDTILGCFAVGLEPSGSADPLGLRRAAIGIWQILLSRADLSAMFQSLFTETRTALEKQGVTLKDDKSVTEFFIGRLRGILIDDGIPVQETDAALAQAFRDPIDARDRARVCMTLPKEAREVFKRIANILDDARGKKLEFTTSVDHSLLLPVETALSNAYRDELSSPVELSNTQLVQALVRIQPQVSAFFDKGGVMVMDPDPALRRNRLSLINAIYERFVRIADFRKLGASS
jgi:glycyl-tRNA synthetase beta chain